MAARTLFYVGDMTNKCIFSTVQFCKPKLYAQQICKQVRTYRNMKLEVNKSPKISPLSYTETGPVTVSKLWKSFCFTVVFSGTTFVAAAIWEYERVRKNTYKILNRLQTFRIRKAGWRHDMELWWRNLTEGQKIFVPICFLNVMVFLAWRVPSFQKIMVKYFSANPASSTLCWPMIFSTFSHYSLLHLAANMYVLHSFSSLAVSALGKEQFVALYLSSGVIGNFASYFYKAVVSTRASSLGASGAIMGILGLVCSQFPDIYLTLIILPMYTFTAGMAIKAIIGFDTMGCLLRWKYLDHAAHLGGVSFGMFWHAWGNANLWQQRKPLLEFWHNLRGPSKS